MDDTNGCAMDNEDKMKVVMAWLEKQKAERVEKTAAEIQAILEKYNTRIIPRTTITGDQVKQDLVIVTNE